MWFTGQFQLPDVLWNWDQMYGSLFGKQSISLTSTDLETNLKSKYSSKHPTIQLWFHENGFYFGMTEDTGEHRKSVRLSNLPTYWLHIFPSILAFNEPTYNFSLLNRTRFTVHILFYFSLVYQERSRLHANTVKSPLVSHHTASNIKRDMQEPAFCFLPTLLILLTSPITWHVLTNRAGARTFNSLDCVNLF